MSRSDNYAGLNEQLTGRCAQQRKLAHNTYAIRREDHIAIRLHNTDILRFYPDGRVVVDVGEWITVTTKDRLNRFLPYGWHIWQEEGVWYVRPSGAWDKSQCWVYQNGITFNPDGTIKGAATAASVMERRKLVRKLRKFANDYVDALMRGEVPAPSAGDCLYCQLRAANRATQVANSVLGENTPTLGESFGDTSHLDSHLEERYYVPSLLKRAVEVFPVASYPMSALHTIWYGDSDPKAALFELLTGATSARSITEEQLSKSLYRYLKRQYGVAA